MRDKAKVKAYNIEYRKLHREELLAKQRAYHWEHRDEILPKLRAYGKKRYEDIRIDLIDSHGGKCALCGYNKNLYVLEFNHMEGRDDRQTVKTKEEADKCVLLCMNCHGEHHAGGMQYV